MLQEILLGLSLALDCFAVSISQGLRGVSHPALGLLALFFGLFQGGMLLLGYGGNLLLSSLFAQVMPWIAAALLGWIGIKMLREGFAKNEEQSQTAIQNAAQLHISDFFILSIATSIDAMAAGVGLPTLEISWQSGFIWVAGFSLMMSVLGGFFGVRWGLVLGQRAEILGGIVLCLLGVKALLS